LETTTADPAPVWRGACPGAPRRGFWGPKKNSNGSWKGTLFMRGRDEVKTWATDAEDFFTTGANERGKGPSRSRGLVSMLSFGAGARPESSLAWVAGTAPRKRMAVAAARASQRRARPSATPDTPGSWFHRFVFMCVFRFLSWGKVACAT